MLPSILLYSCMHFIGGLTCFSACNGSRCLRKTFFCSIGPWLQSSATMSSLDSHPHKQHPQGVMCWLAMYGIQKAVHQCLGATCASAFVLLSAIQFHLPFYMSRTLPNTFATAVLGFALADWVTGGHPRRLICLLALSTVSLGRLLTCNLSASTGLWCMDAVTGTRKSATVCTYLKAYDTRHLAVAKGRKLQCA